VSDVVSIELELGRQLADPVAHEDAGDEGVDLEPEVVTEDRLREQSGGGAVVSPLEVLLVQIALVGQRECRLVSSTDPRQTEL
jgi:hypothetical protein